MSLAPASQPPPEPSTALPPRPAPPRAWRVTIVALAVLLTATSFVATAVTPLLAERHPLYLLALESPIRNLLLARRAPLLGFVLVATARRVLGATVLYLLGRWYGDAALRWFERHAGPSVRRVERFARAYGAPWVFLWPGPLVCIATGAVGLPRRHFALASVSGTLFLVLGCRYAGDFFAAPLDAALGFFARHRSAATAGATLLAVVTAARTVRQLRARAAEDAAASEPAAAALLEGDRDEPRGA